MKKIRYLPFISFSGAMYAAVGAALWASAGGSYAGPLNDTGVEFCRTHEWSMSSRTQTAVTPTTTCLPLRRAPFDPKDPSQGEDLLGHGGEDARYGRDAAAVKGQLTKVGSSTPVQIGVDGSGNPITQPNGFDFTKISNSGAKLPATAALGTGPNDWGCTYDNNTGLMWEVKTYSAEPATKGLRDKDWTYVWHNPARTWPKPSKPADPSSDTCFAVGTCDTYQYVQAVNKAGMCGKTDWRMPSRLELVNIVDNGRANPAIDPTYFPNTQTRNGGAYWTGTQNAFRNSTGYYLATMVEFGGTQWSGGKGDEGARLSVRLVRSGL